MRITAIVAAVLFLVATNIPYVGWAKGGTDSLSYKTEDVHFCNADSSICFGGTLLLPDSTCKNPVVIFVSGTGKQDRDGTMAGHKMFKTIAGYLASRGIASLRTDDRGVGETSGDYAKSTTADFADDVITAIAYLKSRADIDPQNIGLIGHSEGGAVISIAAAKSNDVAFLVSLAGLATNGFEALKKQNEVLVEKSDLPDYDKKRAGEINTLMFETAYRYAYSDSLGQKLNENYERWKKKDDEYVKRLNIQNDHFRFSIYGYTKEATSPWYRYFIRYQPDKFLSKVRIPVLALNGDKDIMVDCKENLAHWKRYLQKAGNKDVTVMVLPGLNHLFLPCKTCTQEEYSHLKEHFSPKALQIIGDWIVSHVQ